MSEVLIAWYRDDFSRKQHKVCGDKYGVLAIVKDDIPVDAVWELSDNGNVTQYEVVFKDGRLDLQIVPKIQTPPTCVICDKVINTHFCHEHDES